MVQEVEEEEEEVGQVQVVVELDDDDDALERLRVMVEEEMEHELMVALEQAFQALEQVADYRQPQVPVVELQQQELKLEYLIEQVLPKSTKEKMKEVNYR